MLKQVLEAYDLLDDARVSGRSVAEYLEKRGITGVDVTRLEGEKGSTDVIRIVIQGSGGKSQGGEAPSLGIIGKLGGVGARPGRIGMVSDAEGAVTAVACALKLADMQSKDDVLKGDVIITTHICPDAPTVPHEPVPFMGSPVESAQLIGALVTGEMDAVLSIDTTRGNRIINHNGFAITPTVKEGYILRVSEDLLDLMQWTTGRTPKVCPVTMQDITPYGNDIYHINSIMQPAIATAAPVVGVAITSELPVPGCGTGANQEIDVASASRFCIETAKSFTGGACRFYDDAEFARIAGLYGRMNILQTIPGQ